MTKEFKIFHKIDTVHGICEECQEDTILVAIVSDFYRCTNCGHDTKQHINGKIRYISLTESDKKFIEINNFLDASSCDEIIERCSSFINRDELGIEYNRQGNSVNTIEHEELKDLDKKIFDRINLFVTKRLNYSFNLGG